MRVSQRLKVTIAPKVDGCPDARGRCAPAHEGLHVHTRTHMPLRHLEDARSEAQHPSRTPGTSTGWPRRSHLLQVRVICPF